MILFEYQDINLCIDYLLFLAIQKQVLCKFGIEYYFSKVEVNFVVLWGQIMLK